MRFGLFNIAIIATVFLTVACNDIKEENKIKKPEFKNSNFWNTLVDENSQNIDVRGQNLEEWIKIKNFYEQEITKIEQKNNDFWKSVKEKNLTLEKIYDLKVPNYNVYISWYQQILSWTNFNLFCLQNDWTFKNIMQNENEQEVLEFYNKAPTLLKSNQTFNKNFEYWKSYMSNELPNQKSSNPWTTTEKQNWIKVANHLNNQFQKQNNHFETLKWYMQIKGWLNS